MKLVGNYSRSGKNENFETEITLTIRENYKHLIQDLDKNELYSIVISKAKDKRTEQQNKYMWALIGEIDKARNGDRSNEDYDIYLEHWAIDKNGGVPDWFEGKNASEEYKLGMKRKKEKLILVIWHFLTVRLK